MLLLVAVAIPQATTAYADAVSTATICAQAAARCTGNCEPNSTETYHGCYVACMHRYDYCMKKWGELLARDRAARPVIQLRLFCP